MKKTEKIAVFIDLANSLDLDLKWIMNEANEAGCVEEARCYGDFRQEHLTAMALDLYALGVTMIHSPSWVNGGSSVKRSDDRLLEKGIRDTLMKRPSISTFVVVTSDSDIIPTCHSILEQKKRLVLYSSMDGILGRILRTCGFEIRPAPKTTGGPSHQATASVHLKSEGRNVDNHRSDNGEVVETAESCTKELGEEDIVKAMDSLEQTSRYMTFMATVGRITNGNAVIKGRVQQRLSHFIERGVVERYEHPIPAIRLNRQHPLVIAALADTRESQLAAVSQ